MAGIQLPQIQRFGPQAPESVGRINVQVPDGSRAFGQITQQIAEGAGEVAQNFMKAEENAADLTSLQAATEFSTAEKIELAKLKAIEGDPTKAYASYDEQQEKRQQEFLKKYEGVSELTQSRIQERMLRARALLNEDRHVNEATQYASYSKKTNDSAVALAQDGMLSASQVLNVEQPDSFLTLRAHIDDIRRTRIQEGRANGFVSVDENGNESYSPYLIEEIKKDVSAGLQNVIKTLNDAGKVEEAQQLLNEYGNDLTAKARVDLSNGNKDSRINNEALVVVDRIKFMNPESGVNEINKIKDLAVREKALEKWDTYQRQIDNQKKRASESAFEDAAEYIRKKREAGQDDLVTVAALNDDKVFKSLKGRMDSKSVDAIEQMIEAPKNSNEKSLESAYDTMFSGGFAGMSYGQFNKTMHGIAEKDRGVFQKEFETANKESGADRRTMVTYMGTQLAKQMQAAGIVKTNYGDKYDNKNQVKITQYYNEMMSIIDTMPPGSTPQDQNKAVQQFVNAKLKEQAFTSFGGEKKTFQSAAPPSQSAVKEKAPAPVAAKPGVPAPATRPPTKEEKNQMLSLWYKTHNNTPWSPADDPGAKKLKQLWDKQGK